MDYIVLSTLGSEHSSLVKTIIFSYDIACQWNKHFLRRQESYPQSLAVDFQQCILKYAIPKFHLPGHGSSCQTPYSFNYMSGVGRTCGEGIEQGWAGQNPLSSSTREMSTGNRSDTLDDHWGGWNFQKCNNLGMFKKTYVYLI